MKRVRIFIFWFHKDYQKGRHKVSINKPFIHSLSDSSLCPSVSLPFSFAPFLYSASSLPPSIPSFQIILFQCLISAGCYRYKGFPCGSAGKESPCNVEDLGLIPGLGRSPGEGKGYPIQYSGLYSPWGCKESDKTKWLSLSQVQTLPFEKFTVKFQGKFIWSF